MSDIDHRHPKAEAAESNGGTHRAAVEERADADGPPPDTVEPSVRAEGKPPTGDTAPPTTGDGDGDKPPWRRRAWAVIDERLGLSALRYPVPEHANNIAWSLGGVTASVLLVLIATGIVLAQFYNPTPEAANGSVRDIITNVWLGSTLRGVHYWGAQAMYVLAVLHLLRVFVTGSYKRPREANWLIGVGMLALVIGAVFTGTVLKWDQESFEALGHNLEIGEFLGGAGLWFSADLSKSIPLLERLYVAHIVIIPGLILALLAAHMLLIKRHGISPDPSLATATGDDAAVEVAVETAEPVEPFTHHLRRVGALGLIVIGVLGVLAVLYPPGIGPSPVEGIEVTKPPWMFWWLYTIENWFGIQAIIWASAALFALLAAVPFIDRNPARSWRKRPVAMTLLGLVLVTMIVFTIITGVSSVASHLG
ncbi:MAG: cytochrome bc complex cytochrome b subunit [Actinobacteria bacterium]|nr:cytochrome bc complex cytochrome b subunit [Actinomycetota bacterium]